MLLHAHAKQALMKIGTASKGIAGSVRLVRAGVFVELHVVILAQMFLRPANATAAVLRSAREVFYEDLCKFCS